tara:strand:+ start:415 stop:1092 length:678 start_codon:yes stop_codon:yes gene_type:complete
MKKTIFQTPSFFIQKLINKQLLFYGIFAASISISGCMPLVIVGTPAIALGSNAISTNQPISSQIHDFAIKNDAGKILKSYTHLRDSSNLEVAVFNNIILLLGQVPSEEIKHEIANKMAKIKYVTVVYDEITIGPKITLGTYANDSWITTKVKSSFIGKVNPTHFKVITEQGVVYLMALTTKSDGAIASKIASHISGVTKVIEIYEYLPAELKEPENYDINTNDAN